MDGMERAPDNLPLRNNLALSLALDGDFDEAIGVFADLIRELEAVDPDLEIGFSRQVGLHIGEHHQIAEIPRLLGG